jgi:hypothetical protein
MKMETNSEPIEVSVALQNNTAARNLFSRIQTGGYGGLMADAGEKETVASGNFLNRKKERKEEV